MCFFLFSCNLLFSAGTSFLNECSVFATIFIPSHKIGTISASIFKSRRFRFKINVDIVWISPLEGHFGFWTVFVNYTMAVIYFCIISKICLWGLGWDFCCRATKYHHITSILIILDIATILSLASLDIHRMPLFIYLAQFNLSL